MSNPITSWIKKSMETYKDREEWMVERISEGSINSQKISDERHGPFKVHNHYHAEMRTKTNFRHRSAISAYAGLEAGNAGSYSALNYYQEGFAKRRDEIMTDIAKNG